MLLLWIPLRQRPGIGTVSNVVLIGLAVDAALALLPAPDALAAADRVAGRRHRAQRRRDRPLHRRRPRPRPARRPDDRARRRARPLRSGCVRTAIEVTVLAIGWLLGGTVGVGTVLYALAIGPLVHVFIPLFTVPPTAPPGRPAPEPST